jgi:hypothetical protein
MGTRPRSGSQGASNAPDANLAQFPDLLKEIQQEWNKAESAIKRSEQIVKEISIPAISELRYAGRRIIDALHANAEGGAHNTDRLKALLEDARFCCHRAQHDAIDAALAKIGIDLDNLTERLGFDAVLSTYPAFREFYADFCRSRDKIVISRHKRDDRNGIYEAITATDLPGLVEHYEKLMAVRPMIKRISLKIKMGGIVGIVIAVATIAAAVFAGLSVDWGKYFPDRTPSKTEYPHPKKSPAV